MSLFCHCVLNRLKSTEEVEAGRPTNVPLPQSSRLRTKVATRHWKTVGRRDEMPDAAQLTQRSETATSSDKVTSVPGRLLVCLSRYCNLDENKTA